MARRSLGERRQSPWSGMWREVSSGGGGGGAEGLRSDLGETGWEREWGEEAEWRGVRAEAGERIA